MYAVIATMGIKQGTKPIYEGTIGGEVCMESPFGGRTMSNCMSVRECYHILNMKSGECMLGVPECPLDRTCDLLNQKY